MSRLWTRFGSWILFAAGLAANILAIVVIYRLVPMDGNLPPGVVVMVCWAVQLAVQRVVAYRAGIPGADREIAEGGDRSRSGSSVRDVLLAVRTALTDFRPDSYTVVVLVLVSFVVFALAAPRAWFDIPWLSAVRYVFVFMIFLMYWAMHGQGFDHRPAGPKPVFASAAERRRHLWQQVWPYGLLVAMLAAFVTGIVLILWLVPVIGVGGTPVVVVSALWLVVWGVAFRLVLVWLGKESAAPRPVFASAAGRRRHLWQQVWPYGLLVAAVAGFVLGFAFILWLAPVAGVGYTPMAIALVFWTVLSGVAFKILINWLESDSLPQPVASPIREREPQSATRLEPVGVGVLSWDEGARRCAVKTSEQLRDQVLRLHLSTVDLPRFADFAPSVGVPVSISLGDEESLLVTVPVDGTPPLVVTMGPEGLRTVPVASSDGARSVFPPSAAIPMEVAIDVLAGYCATGELPNLTTGPKLGDGGERSVA
ncbi:Imm1 family immunity protein [Catellatospora sichuanensis]|uniref:Imm1 family immunity protein n=1 Tax=Catellatospora sichuanensis TaxID=1969805 RepID=UPI001183AE01|nr:Imm1 family immunity protein [Catellatospora sichuanensis]